MDIRSFGRKEIDCERLIPGDKSNTIMISWLSDVWRASRVSVVKASAGGNLIHSLCSVRYVIGKTKRARVQNMLAFRFFFNYY